MIKHILNIIHRVTSLYTIHMWYDTLYEPKRFLVFLFGLGIPYVASINLLTLLPNKYTLVLFLIFNIPLLTRIKYIYKW